MLSDVYSSSALSLRLWCVARRVRKVARMSFLFELGAVASILSTVAMDLSTLSMFCCKAIMACSVLRRVGASKSVTAARTAAVYEIS